MIASAIFTFWRTEYDFLSCPVSLYMVKLNLPPFNFEVKQDQGRIAYF